MSACKFAIAGNVGKTVFFWAPRKSRPWTVMESRAKTWAKRPTAEKWLPRATPGRAMDNLRVLEVAP